VSDLEAKLKECSDARLRLIVTDGVFSMDGGTFFFFCLFPRFPLFFPDFDRNDLTIMLDIAPLDKICDLADKYKAVVMIDECHATGFIGMCPQRCPSSSLSLSFCFSRLTCAPCRKDRPRHS
jgi:glycine C-acetyltransferase